MPIKASLAFDFINDAHIKIINVAKKYGEVIVGLLTDKAIAKYKSIPIINSLTTVNLNL